MKSAILAFIAASAGLSLPAGAAPLTVTWGAQNAGGALGTNAGSELSAGALVRLGIFDLPAEQVRDLAWNPAALEPHFTELARARVGTFGGENLDVAGAFAASSPLDSTELPLALLDQPLCVWACEAPALADATQVGIFSSPNWVLHAGQFGALTWDLNEVGATDVWVGTFGPKNSPTLGGSLLQLASLSALADQTDLDADGAVRLLEEAFGMNPNFSDAQNLPSPLSVSVGGSARPGLQFRRQASGAAVNSAVYESQDFRYTVEVSSDLQQWVVNPTACAETSVSPLEGGLELVTLCVDGETAGVQRFFRVRVERL